MSLSNNKIFAVVAVVIIIAAATAAVVLTNNGSDKGGDDPKPVVPDDDYYPVTVKTYDPAKAEMVDVTFTERPKNIIAFQGGALELLLYFGLGDSITKAYVKNNYVLCNQSLQSELKKVTVEPRENGSVETLISLQPDLIVGWSSTFKETAQQTMDFWAKRNVNCLVSNSPNSTVEDVCNTVKAIGIVFNMQEKAQKYIDTMNKNIDTIKKKTAGISDADKPSVLAIEIGYEGSAYCYGSNYITGKLIALAGAKSAFDGGMTKLTYEQIAGLKPDVILLVVNSGDFRSEENVNGLIKNLKSIEGFASIPAIQNDRIIHYGLYEVYQSGIIPEDILERLYNDIYPPTSSLMVA